MAAAQPQALGGAGLNSQTPNGGNANDPYGCQTDPHNSACQSCTNNPTSAACKALAAAAANVSQPTVGFQDAPAPVKDSSFNVGNSDGLVQQTQFGNYQPQENKVNTVANNSGGAIPGGGGGSNGGATLGGGSTGAPRGPSAGSPGFTTDIDQGFRGGGYSPPAGGGSDASGGSGVGPNSNGKGGARDPAGLVGTDLKKYLNQDPTSHIGGFHIPTVQLEPHWSNIFEKVHEAYIRKCYGGQLVGCLKP